jgi:hypothetical protein
MFVVINWIVALCGNNKISWDELSALVQELIEGVLGVGGWLAEENRTGGVFNHVVVPRNRLAIGLHRQLLEVGGEPVEVLVESEIINNYNSRRTGRGTYGDTR